ncbi:pantetheine-phosphate adenylyltransferase [Kovacikia minuta]|uniref:pantetheine-phosphate adenylyltransferase n=1 Tax=Kovacikia minuta TaxID=2931930 RepID=UPI0036F30BC7
MAFPSIIASVALVPPVLAIYPGSFDPITLGHLDIIERGCKLFDQVVVAVLRNPNKSPLFTVAERIEQIRRTTLHLPNVEVDSFDGLTVNYARMRQAQVLLRGLRVLSDFEMELQMAHTNKTLSDQIETVFLATSNEYSFLSSSLVKEIARFGGSIDHLVPHHVAPDIYRCYAKTHPVLPLTLDSTPVPESPKMEPPVENR